MISGAFHSLPGPAVALGLAALPQSLLACAACFGKSDDSMAQGMNMGIFTLLIVIVSVLVGIASFGIFLTRRSARFPNAAAMPSSSPELAAKASQPPVL
jgi:hypothetical protein